ncbi:MAG: hypothetical protein WC340_18050 [Kiritimatiellia bacterium]
MTDEAKLRIMAVIGEIEDVADEIEYTHEGFTFMDPAKKRTLQVQALRKQVETLLKLTGEVA